MWTDVGTLLKPGKTSETLTLEPESSQQLGWLRTESGGHGAFQNSSVRARVKGISKGGASSRWGRTDRWFWYSIAQNSGKIRQKFGQKFGDGV